MTVTDVIERAIMEAKVKGFGNTFDMARAISGVLKKYYILRNRPGKKWKGFLGLTAITWRVAEGYQYPGQEAVRDIETLLEIIDSMKESK